MLSEFLNEYNHITLRPVKSKQYIFIHTTHQYIQVCLFYSILNRNEMLVLTISILALIFSIVNAIKSSRIDYSEKNKYSIYILI